MPAEFPKDFLWATATSAYQVEGAWNEDVSNGDQPRQRPFILGCFCAPRQSTVIADGSTGDTACDSYHKFHQDLQLLIELGVNSYRFSISWPRLLPNGTTKIINHKGVEYYHGVIDKLKENNIRPLVTLFHWDTPLELEKQGGWLNPNMVTWFRDYAEFCFQEFGNKVDFWVTLNEPSIFAWFSFGSGEHAPGRSENRKTEPYLVMHHMTLAHYEAWKAYDKKFREKQNGLVGFTGTGLWHEPYDPDNQNDCRSADLLNLTQFGMTVHPFFHPSGGYPKKLVENVENLSKAEGLSKSRLPELSPEQIAGMKGCSDFIGLNYYTGKRIKHTETPSGKRGFAEDCKAQSVPFEEAIKGKVGLYNTPECLRKSLSWIKNQYGDYPIYILENGFSPAEESLDDVDRVVYFKEHVKAVFDALTLDKVNIHGYTAWCLMDNFEWAHGFTARFGLAHVNFNNEDKKRILKTSGKWYKRFLKEGVKVLQE